MALFTDTGVVTLNDLLLFENSLVQISTAHNIDVLTKINLATEAIANKLTLWLLNSWRSDPQWLQGRVIGLSNVVATPPLYRWICFDSLARFFAEAYNVQLNTRFQGKWTEYKQEAAGASDMAFTSGLGIVYNPLPRPALPVMNVGAGSALAQSLFFETTWVDSKGCESAASPANGLLLENFSSVTVTAAAAGPQPPPTATGWNVYASSTDASLQLQNTSPVPLGFSWQLPVTGLASGAAPSGGQRPDIYITLSKRILRG